MLYVNDIQYICHSSFFAPVGYARDMQNGTLYIVGTPIGNLEDITLRALRILTEVHVVFCEDTRVTRRLCERHTIDTHLKSLNARTEGDKIDTVLAHLQNGEDVAYVSDAGTPGISDPGTLLVARAREAGIDVVTIPGPSALTAAVSIAGVPASEFVFLGFLPHKKGRHTRITEIADSARTVVLYESTHRIVKLMRELDEALPLRRVVLLRELSKMHEEVLTGTSHELATTLEATPVKQKGEFVVVIAPQ